MLWLLMTGWIAAQAGAGIVVDREVLFGSLDVMDWIGKPVSDSRWRQVARVERLLFDPRSGRATFVVLSFVGKEGLWAVPWNEVSVDSRGRARLKMDERALDRSILFHGDRRYAFEPTPNPDEDSDGSTSVFRAGGDGDELLRGTVMGLASLPMEPGGRRTIALLEIGDEILRVDLGSESALADRGVGIRAGDALEITARRTSLDGWVATEIRLLQSAEAKQPSREP